MFPLDALVSGGGCPDLDIRASRRGVLFAPLLAALSLAMSGRTTRAGKIDPSETAITLPGSIEWAPWSGLPPKSGEMAGLYGDLNGSGPYVVLMKWHPGYMSAPHTYATDRLSLVLSGTWWVNSGPTSTPTTRFQCRLVDSSGALPAPRITTASRRTRRSQPSLHFSELHPSCWNWWIRANPAGVKSDARIARKLR